MKTSRHRAPPCLRMRIIGGGGRPRNVDFTLTGVNAGKTLKRGSSPSCVAEQTMYIDAIGAFGG